MYKILVVANMSAGKSAFINALIGQKVNKSQNMACTSDIYTISSRYQDSDEVIEIADRHAEAYFRGRLAKQKFDIVDTPGVNSSMDDDHRNITLKAIDEGQYNLLVMLMNATQLGTEDDDNLLEYIKEKAKDKQILFVINKIDAIRPEEESFDDIIRNQTDYLVKKGFEDPIVCPISAKAALLFYLTMDVNVQKMDRKNRREFDFMCDIMRTLNIKQYYKKKFKKIYSIVPSSRKKKEKLLVDSGIYYVEEFILSFMRRK